MSDRIYIHEHELDGALNALFLNTYSQKEDEGFARFVMQQEYNVVIDANKERELLARLVGKQGGGKNIFLLILALLFIAIATFFFIGGNKQIQSTAPSTTKINVTPQQTTTNFLGKTESIPENASESKPSPEEKIELKTPTDVSPPLQYNPQANNPEPPPQTNNPAVNPPAEEKELPYFNKEGLAYFAKVKERMLQKLVKIDDFLYCKTAPGATMYKSREVIISPFVMSNFPVTNLQYKTFLADLALQGRVDDLKRCLPKEEVWKEYGCIALAKNYFETEAYNDFPVVNISKEACVIFCQWMEEEMNQALEETVSKSKVKSSSSGKKRQVVVRLPYDYEWIYSADAAYTLIPNCGGYNTIYDASEGLVDKGFFKRTSQVNKRELRKETRMDKLSDVNRFGMTEAEMIAIYKEAMSFKSGSSGSVENPFDPASYPNNIEACCLAGHVCELIKDKEGGMIVRGCCWKDKEEYLKMMEGYKKNGASPFIGFRVMIQTTERGPDKDPFW